jgi:hypothetical protein
MSTKRLKVKESSDSEDGVEEARTSRNSLELGVESAESTKKLKPNECMIENSDSNNENQKINVELQQFIIHNNKYRLIEEIANGAFATVFKAEEISTKKMLL